MAKFQGKSVRLNKPSRITKGQAGFGRKKFKVFVKSGSKVKKVMFGDPNMRIKKSSPARRKSFRARHKCATAKDRTTAKYWACKDLWSASSPKKTTGTKGRVAKKKTKTRRKK